MRIIKRIFGVTLLLGLFGALSSGCTTNTEAIATVTARDADASTADSHRYPTSTIVSYPAGKSARAFGNAVPGYGHTHQSDECRRHCLVQ